jgi:hypothetical protein
MISRMRAGYTSFPSLRSSKNVKRCDVVLGAQSQACSRVLQCLGFNALAGAGKI